MEFPDLGKYCSWPLCNQLDFLPFTCENCKLIFCKDHINGSTHDCKVTSFENIDQTPVSAFICTFEGCNSRSPVEMNCPKCSQHYCLLHRYHTCFENSSNELDVKKEALQALKQQFSESLSQVNKIIDKGIEKSMQNPKKQEMAQKVNLLRLKGKAKGPVSVPPDKRIYFLIIFPQDFKAHMSQPVFTSQDWSIGRVIDSVSDVCGVPNHNNVLNAKKLRLFKKSDGLQISSDVSNKISELLSDGRLINGETLILEYVSQHEDLSSYKLMNHKMY